MAQTTDFLPSGANLKDLPPLPDSPELPLTNPNADRYKQQYLDEADLPVSPDGRPRGSEYRSSWRTNSHSTLSNLTNYPQTSSRQLSNLSPRKDRASNDINPTPHSIRRTYKTTSALSDLLAPPRPAKNERSVSGFAVPPQAMEMSMLMDCAPLTEMTDLDASVILPRSPSGLPPPSHKGYPEVDVSGPKGDFHDGIPLPSSSSAEIATSPSLGQSVLLPSTKSLDAALPLSTRALECQAPPRTAASPPFIPPLPKSSSANSLGSDGDHMGASGTAGDVSTLFPVSAKKNRHLLQDENLLKKETMTFDDLSMMDFRQPLPATGLKNRQAVRQAADPDMTMDVGALMAQMKGKRALAGIEESFVDLLHGNDGFEGLNTSILGGADESFLPPSLRPAWGRNGTMPSPAKRAMDRAPTTPATLRSGIAPGTASRSTHQRSRSLHDSGLQRTDAPLSSHRQRLASPAQAAHNPTTPTVARPRLGMTPTASKRVSLSAGAVPMTMNASHKKMELPVRTPRAVEPTSLGRSKSIDRRSRLIQGDGSPVLSQARLDAPRRGVSTPARLLKERVVPAARSEQIVLREPTLPVAEPAQRIRTQSGLRQPSNSILPRVGSHARTESTPAATVTAPRGPTASSGTNRTLMRPTSIVRPPGSSNEGNSASRALPRSLSKPSLAPKASREFGKDASAATNRDRISRLPAPSLASKRSIGAKLSSDSHSPASPSKRAETVSAKSRALSTPASAIVRPRPGLSQTAQGSDRHRMNEAPKLSTGPNSTSRTMMSSLAVPTGRLPRPATGSRLPPASTGLSNAGFDDLKARLNKLSMRQPTGRSAK